MLDLQDRTKTLEHRLELDTQRVTKLTDRDVLRDGKHGFDDLRFAVVLVKPIPQLFRHPIRVHADLNGQEGRVFRRAFGETLTWVGLLFRENI